MNKKLFVIILFLFSFSLVSAYRTNYDVNEGHIYKEKITKTKYLLDEHFTWPRTTYIDYDNDRRYPTYDYRYGYTYRATTDYLNRYNTKKKISKNYEKDFSRDSKNHEDYYSNSIILLRSYEKEKCYYTAPKDKLFYIKC
ncbi:MAG: hypothetical protein ABIH79_03085 [archaeon]